MAGNYGVRSLEETPTWAVATVCAVIVIVSFVIEFVIHSLGKWFHKRRNKAMIEALEKMKDELMILGFISLLLVVATSYIAKICIPVKVGHTMLPCRKDFKTKKKVGDSGDDARKLLSYSEDMIWRRLMAEANYKDYCGAKGKVSLISYYGVHQLHIFIFVLAVFHIFYSVLIMVLGQAKMKKWKAWELETSSLEYQFTNDPARFRFAHQTSFVRRHTGLSTAPGIRWILAFFRQFFGSISKVDYLTIRNGFINAHFAPNSKFDFHKYIKRSMEDDFKLVLGISVPLWMFAVVFLLLNVYKWYTLSWIAVVPPVILLLVGTKLELVIMEMAQRIQDRATVVRGALIVEPSDNYFWFSRPRWILFLIHFTLFQNAFQMAFFLWAVYEFGIKSCLHENLVEVVLRVCLGFAIHIMCSYITFPLYALVTQMGSDMKQPIFEEQTAKALKKWRKDARDRKKLGNAVAGAGAADDSNAGEGENTPIRASSPVYLLQRYRSSSTAVDSESVANPSRVYQSDIHAPPPTLEQTDYPEIKEESRGVTFTFGKP